MTTDRFSLAGGLAAHADAGVIVTGDLNDFDLEQPLSVLKGTATVTGYDVPAGADPINATATYTPGGTAILADPNELLPAQQRFDDVVEGSSESLDHMLATASLAATASFDAVHLNS